jgi:hypothetical protein
MPPRIDPEHVAQWAELAERLGHAPHGQRGDLVRDRAAALGISIQTCYRRLETYGGWTSGRIRVGKSRLDDATLKEVAAVYREGSRENGKQVMTVDLACSILEQSGRSIPVSGSQVSRLLRGARLDRRGQDLAQHFGQMRSPHPNYAHQVDPSLCLIYYMGGRQRIIRESEFYKNKLDAVAKIDRKCWRYVLTDHASSLIHLRYFEARGESQALLFEFLTWAWGRAEGRLGHGVPRYLVMDPGSANIGRGIGLLLDALDVEAIVHRPEQAHVKGQVEGAQNIVERQFESRLRFEPVESIDALNLAAGRWQEGWNANALPRIDSRLRRPGAPPMVRSELWLRIRPEELRELPSREACARLLEGKPEERTVSERGRISYRHPAAGRSCEYDLSACEGVHRGDKVLVSPMLVPLADGSQHAIRVRWEALDGAEQVWRLGPLAELDAFGLPAAAPAWGEYRGQPKRDAERRADELARLAYPGQTDGERDAQEGRRKARRDQVTPFQGQLNALAHLGQVQTPTYLPRSGETLRVDVPEDRREAVPLVGALMRLSRAWERPVSAAEQMWLRARWPETVPADELDRLLAAGSAGQSGASVAAEGGRAGLSVVR